MEELHYGNDSGTFQVSHRKTQSHNMPESHFHGTYEIYYLISGQRSFFIKERTILVNEGEVVIVSPSVLHRTTNAAKSEHERLIVNIHRNCMGIVDGTGLDILQPLFDRDYVVFSLALHERLSVDAFARKIVQEIRERKPGYELYVLTLVQQLLVVCCRQITNGNMEPLGSRSPMHERISEIVRYINAHYMQDLSLQMVADRFYVSSYYLSRFFKEVTGFLFVEYLNSVRINEAIKLLEQSSLKVGEIAKKVGFGSVTHFGRVFKSITGRVPLHYRKESKKSGLTKYYHISQRS